jgi:hypothetical protein
MCAKLGIRIIPASSPQAKGRIERHHGTHQDRLVKKLRRKAIADIAAANAFLETEYWADHNDRFAGPPTSPDDFHRAVPRRLSLDHVFRLEETRTVSNDWVVRYANRHLQLERQSPLPPARSTVQVCEDVGGHIDIRYRDRSIRWTELAAPPLIKPGVAAPRRPPSLPPSSPSPRRRGQPSADHPWQHTAAEHRDYLQFARNRRAWERVQP